MYQLYGFMGINNLINNDLNEVSRLGELSPQALSFSREIGYYTHPDYDNIRLHVFSSKDDNGRVEPSIDYVNELIQLGSWLAKEALLNNITNNRVEFIQKLNAEYGNRIIVEEVGKMVTNDTYWLPESITFKLLSDNRINLYKVWFADKSFRHQYDEYELEVIPPFIVVDDFHKAPHLVKTALTEHIQQKMMDLHNRVNQRANEKPYTYIFSYKYDYINPNDKTDRTPTVWTVIIYGEHGRNEDIIRESIAHYILNNSDYDRLAWEKILPDIFIPTEFYISPFWTKFATENLQLRGGIYSPQVPLREATPWGVRTMYGFESQHIADNAVTFGTIYKSMAVLACGHPRNRLAPVHFEEHWPEYCNIYTTSRDFNRVSPRTQDFIMLINKLFLEAETMTPESDVPYGMTRSKRGNLYYLSAMMENIYYLVPLRWNFLNEVTNDQNSSIALPVVNNAGTTADLDKRVDDVVNIVPNISGNVRGAVREKEAIVVSTGNR